MAEFINAKQLRAKLKEIVERVRRGERFTVLYRSQPAFEIVPVGAEKTAADSPLDEDPLYRAGSLGHSTDGRTSGDHDEQLYGEA